jgi:predicted CoA-substrate-specific enzyme activase
MRGFSCGLDIGSTTIKVAIRDEDRVIFSSYRRHNARINETLAGILTEAKQRIGNEKLLPLITGSAGMGVAERLGIPFMQEIVVQADYIRRRFPDVATLIEIGGEDSKVVFFDRDRSPELRMNGSCAGGTGAFIDQMAALMKTSASGFHDLALRGANIYPIASRCGVFGKTDVQALMSRNIPREDIALSVFQAIAAQVVAGLARGRDLKSPLLFAGGPLTFFPMLRKSFCNVLQIPEQEARLPEGSEILPAIGCAFYPADRGEGGTVDAIVAKLSASETGHRHNGGGVLEPLFANEEELIRWKEDHERDRVERIDPEEAVGLPLFLGVDSGSTTTKIVLTDPDGRYVAGKYIGTDGDPLQALQKGIDELLIDFESYGWMPRILRSCATGYGEDLMRASYNIDDGIVETAAHYLAAKRFDENVSFILDIGGQDMKAIHIRDGAVSDILINEACSSGCGSFLETFSRSMECDLESFARNACFSDAPFDLGTRCTVFMNSKVKEALRDGAGPESISAGLAYSVVRNALFKVLQLRDPDSLGKSVIAQGGTFHNPAVLRALEKTLNRRVIRPDISGMMGAYGAALAAMANYEQDGISVGLETDSGDGLLDEAVRLSGFQPFTGSRMRVNHTTKQLVCHGCENSCGVTQLRFENGARCHTGNRCERVYSNFRSNGGRGVNLWKEKLKLLNDKKYEKINQNGVVFGIPLVLNFYDDLPFWRSFLTACGFRVVVSDPNGYKNLETGLSTVVSDNICFPAKIVHSHIFDLAEKGIDRIFYPIVVRTGAEFKDAKEAFHCPVVTGYADVIKSSVDPEKRFGIPIDTPAFSSADPSLFRKQLQNYFGRFGVESRTIAAAFDHATEAQAEWKRLFKERGREVVERAEREGRMVIVLAGRPYHADPMIHKGIPEMLAGFGVDVLTEDSLPINEEESLSDLNVLTQWTFTNRLYAAARWTRGQKNAELLQITSFGCGPDAISSDEIREILRSAGKNATAVKMDEISNLGAVKIRLRSMIEAIRLKHVHESAKSRSTPAGDQAVNPAKRNSGSIKHFIVPHFSPLYSPLMPSIFKSFGYTLDVLPPQDRESLEFGLRNMNQEMCYPAILIAGDIVRAFQTGGYHPEETAVILSMTGGQCRASSYVPLVRKALSGAGFPNVRVMTFSTADLNSLQGLELNIRELVKQIATGVIFLDALSDLYFATVSRELEKGRSLGLHEIYMRSFALALETGAPFDRFIAILEKAVEAFNQVPVTDAEIPVIGIAGEIFVKYNYFAGGNLIEWLIGEGVEVRLPSLQNFFLQEFINETFNRKQNLKKGGILDPIKIGLLRYYVEGRLKRLEKTMSAFRYARRQPDLDRLARDAERITSLANQSGEGWLLVSEMIAMIEDGVEEIAILQPFGCISNHITGKGIERRMMELYPGFTPLFLDVDAGSSEVNLVNRLRLLINSSKEKAERRNRATAQV